MVGGFFCAVWSVCLASSRCTRFVRLRVKQLEVCVSKLCRTARRVIIEVVVAKLDNWRRAISGKVDFKPNRKKGFGQLQLWKQVAHYRRLNSSNLIDLARSTSPYHMLCWGSYFLSNLGKSQLSNNKIVVVQTHFSWFVKIPLSGKEPPPVVQFCHDYFDDNTTSC